MYNLEYTNLFKRAYKFALKIGYEEILIEIVISIIANKMPLPAKYKAHKLTGANKDCWECHIQHDSLLIWKIIEESNSLILINTGTHSDLF